MAKPRTPRQNGREKTKNETSRPNCASWMPQGAWSRYRRTCCHAPEAETPATKATTTQTTAPPMPTQRRTAGLRGSSSVPSTSARKSGASRRASSTLTRTTTRKAPKPASPTSTCAQKRVQKTPRKPTSPNHSQST